MSVLLTKEEDSKDSTSHREAAGNCTTAERTELVSCWQEMCRRRSRAVYMRTSPTDGSEVEEAGGVGRQIVFFVESSDVKADQGIVRGRGARCQSMASGYILSHCFRECQSHDVWLMFVAVSHN
jgi:hypothetical protein